MKLDIRIDVKQYPNQLQSYGSNYLNYESINFNKSLGLRRREMFDYRVKTPVDLSKLFLPTYKTGYVAFDESCGLHAVLSFMKFSNATICAQKVSCHSHLLISGFRTVT